VAVCRELTKVHEQLVRGPITRVLSELGSPLGEYTVVANIGQSTEVAIVRLPTATEMLVEFGQLTNNERLSRRSAVTTLAKRHKMGANAIYKLIETGKKMVE